mmetsp:Transcript_129948/g.259227  ORF Transcript_129948/g.259227 Transcript_129948/m.259227 type:complete len:237 (-) Transcript_129948:300-1010(-)
MATTEEDPRIKRLEEVASIWKAHLHVRNTFLESRINEEQGSAHGGSKASSDPTHSNSSINTSFDSFAQSVDEEGGDVTPTYAEGHMSMAASSTSLGFSGESSGLSALALSDATAVPSTTPSASTLHAEGRCSPCHFFSTTKGCRAGTTCKFCHMPHDIPPRTRPCKERRAKAKRLADAMLRQPSEVCTSTITEQSLASASDEPKNPSYLQQVIRSKLKSEGALSPRSVQRSRRVSL